MSNESIVSVFILFLLAAGIIMLFIARNEKPQKKFHPSVGCTTMQYYDADYITISEAIDKARNLYHLQSINEHIYLFKKRYQSYQEPVILQIDTNRLRRLWKEKKVSFEIRMAIFL